MAALASPGPARREGSDKPVVTPVSAVGQSHVRWRPGARAGVFQVPLYTEQARNLLNKINKKKSALAQAQETAAF